MLRTGTTREDNRLAVRHGCRCILIAVLVTIAGCDRSHSVPTQQQPLRQPPPTVAEKTPPAQPVVDPIELQQQTAAALEAGEFGAALQLARRAKRAAPDDPQTTYLMARVLAERNRFSEAVKMLDDLAVSVPEARLPALGQTAEWLVYQGHWQEAERRYRILLDEVDDTTLIDGMLSQLLLRQGRRMEATTYLQKLCRQGNVMESSLRSLLTIAMPFPGDATSEELEPIGALGHARAEISQGNFSSALARLDPSTAQSPDETSLRGRIYALQQDFDGLSAWAEGRMPVGVEETADYWFARGTLESHNENSRAAVKCFCESVRRDPTDHLAYHALSQSLEQIGATSESQEALERAEQIQKTQLIGSQMADSDQRDLQAMSELTDTLVQLRRPIEALGWRAVQVYYGRASQSLSEQQAAQAIREINRQREQVLNDDTMAITEQFICCGVDPETI